MNYRKSIFAAVLTLPLVLAACGSDEEANSDASSSNSSSSSAKTSSSKSDADKKKEEEAKKKEEEAKKKDEAAKKAEAEKKAAEGQPAEGEEGAAPAQGGNNPGAAAPKPIEGGQPANEGDSQQINALVMGYNGRDIDGFFDYTIDNACPSYVNANGGPEAMRIVSKQMTQSPDWDAVGRQGPTVEGVNNIQVNGDRASADVTMTYPGADSITEVTAFSREGGKWTFCPQQ